jgi:hypothetical protein
MQHWNSQTGRWYGGCWIDEAEAAGLTAQQCSADGFRKMLRARRSMSVRVGRCPGGYLSRRGMTLRSACRQRWSWDHCGWSAGGSADHGCVLLWRPDFLGCCLPQVGQTLPPICLSACIAGTGILFEATKGCPNALLCMPNRTKCLLSVFGDAALSVLLLGRGRGLL